MNTSVEPRRSAIHRPPPTVSPRDLSEEICSPVPPLVLDLREELEYRAGHLTDSVSSPDSDTGALMEKVRFSSRRIILVCSNGRVGANVARMLGVCGFPEVTYLQGGVEAWKAADLPLLETTRRGTERRAHAPHADWAETATTIAVTFSRRALFAGLAGSALVLGVAAWLILR